MTYARPCCFAVRVAERNRKKNGETFLSTSFNSDPDALPIQLAGWAGQARGNQSAISAYRSAILEASVGLFGTEREFSLRKHGLQRGAISAHHPDADPNREARSSIPRRWTGTKLHLYCRAQTGNGVHYRHPKRKLVRAPDVQSPF